MFTWPLKGFGNGCEKVKKTYASQVGTFCDFRAQKVSRIDHLGAFWGENLYLLILAPLLCENDVLDIRRMSTSAFGDDCSKVGSRMASRGVLFEVFVNLGGNS